MKVQPKPKSIKLIEDDENQAVTIRNSLERRYGAHVEVFESELEFRTYLNTLSTEDESPDVIVSDCMVRWELPSENPTTPPQEVTEGTFRKAGIRCWAKARATEATKKTPWIYLSVLDAKTIGFHEHYDDATRYVAKTGSLEPFFNELDDLLELNKDWKESEREVTDAFLSNFVMKRVLLEGISTPLLQCRTVLP